MIQRRGPVMIHTSLKIQLHRTKLHVHIPAQRLTGNQPSQPQCFVGRFVDYYFLAFFTGVRGTAFTALSSTAGSLAAGLSAPVGIRVVVTVWASSVPV